MTMYERLMTLPIFKGVGTEQLSLFLEKTHLDFDNYDAGAVIQPLLEDCNGLKCVLSGRIEMVHTLSGGEGRLVAEYGSGKVLGLERLFGMDTRPRHEVRALEPCGTMSFSKEQYMSLLRSNHICLINYLNYLNYHCQRIEVVMESLYSRSVAGTLATIVSLMTDRDCRRIVLEGMDRLWTTGPENAQADYDSQVDGLVDAGYVRFGNEGEIIIESRQSLLDYAESLQEQNR